jgi:hypothetical protein
VSKNRIGDKAEAGQGHRRSAILIAKGRQLESMNACFPANSHVAHPKTEFATSIENHEAMAVAAHCR